MNAICGNTILKNNNFKWIDSLDLEFIKIFKDSIEYIESKNKINHELFNSMSNQPANKEKIKEYSQFYTPSDVALYSAYQLLKNFDVHTDIIFDPCAGKGSLLIAIGVVLALKFNLRDEELLSKLYGSEICFETYNETIENIIYGLNRWISGINKSNAKNILLCNIVNKDFHNVHLPKNSLVIVNPPYKEIKGKGNAWLSFSNIISKSINVKSFAMIVPVSICSADRTLEIRELILNNYNEIIALHHDTRPRPLFKNIEQRISIIVAHKNSSTPSYKTTGFLTHKSGERAKVWEQDFTSLEYKYCKKVFPKISNKELLFFYKHQNAKNTIADYVNEKSNTTLWIRTTGRYSLLAQLEKPEEITTKWKNINIEQKGAKLIIRDFQNGETLKWWKIFGDGRDISIPKFLNNYGVLDE